MNEEALDFWQRASQALKTVDTLVSTDPDAAASRAYYAAFYAISALFSLQGKSFVKHSAVEAAADAKDAACRLLEAVRKASPVFL